MINGKVNPALDSVFIFPLSTAGSKTVFGGYPVEPCDIAPPVRHLHATRDFFTYSNKAIALYSLGGEIEVEIAARNTPQLLTVRLEEDIV